MIVKIENIVSILKNAKILHKPSSDVVDIYAGAAIHAAEKGHISFLGNQFSNVKDVFATCCASLILLDSRIDTSDVDFSSANVDCVISVSDARISFIKVLNEFFPKHVQRGEIHPTATIAKSAQLHPSVSVAHGVVIEEHCVIGENSFIGSHTILHEGTIIGANTVVEAHSTIGSDGFGFQRDEDGVLHKFPHSGDVVIGDNVEIGCSVCIDRGTMSSTVIGDGCKIDNFVHIAHNVVLGDHVLVVAQAGICGSVRVGQRAYIGPSSCISQGVQIGDDSFVGLGAFVTQNVEAGQSVLGRGVGYLLDRRPREQSLGGSWKPS